MLKLGQSSQKRNMNSAIATILFIYESKTNKYCIIDMQVNE